MRSRADRRGRVRPGFPLFFGGAEHLTPERRFGFLRAACCLGVLALAPAALAAPVLDPDNGHYYEAVARNAGTTWNAANDAANARTFMGMHGHLATIPSPAVNNFLLQQFPDAVAGYYCLGGMQSHGLLDPAAGWMWVTGAPMGYTNWQQAFFTGSGKTYTFSTGSKSRPTHNSCT